MYSSIETTTAPRIQTHSQKALAKQTLRIVLVLAQVLSALGMAMVGVVQPQFAPWAGTPAMVWAAPAVAPAAPAAPQPNTEVSLELFSDGAAPFDALDADGNNDIVRTFDSLIYRVDWNVNEQDATNVVIRLTVPTTMTYVTWPDYYNAKRVMPPGCLTSGVSPPSSLSADRKTLVCNVGSHLEGSAGTFFPRLFVGAQLSGQVFDMRAEIDTDQTTPVTSNPVPVTIAAIPAWDWIKSQPDVYTSITRTDGITGNIYIWPIYVIPGSFGGKGSEPMNDAVPIQFYDQAWNLTPNATFVSNPALYAGYPSNRNACGGYDKVSGSLPFGDSTVPGATAQNTTVGAWAGTETIACTVNPNNQSPGDGQLVRIDISGHNTFEIAPKTSGDGLNLGVAIAMQIAFFAPSIELNTKAAATSNRTFLTNTIMASPPVSRVLYAITPTIDPIQVSGSVATVDEVTTTNNTAQVPYFINTSTGGGGGVGGGGTDTRVSIDTYFVNGPFQQAFSYDDANHILFRDGPTGRSIFGRDIRGPVLGGTGSGRYDINAFQTARSQVQTLQMRLSTDRCNNVEDTLDCASVAGGVNVIPQAQNYFNYINSCQWVDTQYFELVQMPAIIPATGIIKSRASSAPSTGEVVSVTATNPLVQVIYGDKISDGDRYGSGSWVRERGVYSYVVEVAHSATGSFVGNGNVLTDTVTCNTSDADARGWVPVNGNLSVFQTTPGNGVYDGINMIRLRTLEPVPFQSVNGGRYGLGFVLFVQGRAKLDRPTNPAGADIYTHASYAEGDWRTGNAPPTTWHNKSYSVTNAFDPPGAIEDRYDYLDPNAFAGPPHAVLPNNANGVYRAYHDRMQIVEAYVGLTKQNVAGNADYVDVGELVTFTLQPSIVGSAVDTFTNIYIQDPLPTYYEFVTATVGSTPGSTLLQSGSSLLWRFGPITQSQPGGWSDLVTLTVRVGPALADQLLYNGATAAGTRVDNSTSSKSSFGLAYMVGSYHRLQIHKTVNQPLGSCSQFVAQSDPSPVPWDTRCARMNKNGDITFTLYLTDTGAERLGTLQIIDALPFNGDALEPQTTFSGTPSAPANTVGDGRDPASAFAGTNFLRLIRVRPVTAGFTSTVYYTTDPVNTVQRDARTLPNNWVLLAHITGTAVVTGFPINATAFRVDIAGSVVGQAQSIDLVMGTNGNKTYDLYTNNFGVRSNQLRLPVRSNDVSGMPESDLVLRKYTNGYDADTGTGPAIQVGQPVTWTYVVTNNGGISLTIAPGDLHDDIEGPINTTAFTLTPGSALTLTYTGTATAMGQYTNTAEVTGTSAVPGSPITATNLSHYFGITPSIVLRKYTNGYDAEVGTGPLLQVNQPVTWTYVVTNTGNTTLAVAAGDLRDDHEGSINPAGFTLAPNATLTLTHLGTTTAGQYVNTGVVTATPIFSSSVPITPDLPGFPAASIATALTATNPSRYFGVTPSIVLRKYTNGYDADGLNVNAQPLVNVGEPVTWTYVVTNIGNVTLTVAAGGLYDDPEGPVNAAAFALAPSESLTLTHIGTAGANTATGGQYTNTGTVTGTPTLAAPVPAEPDLPGFPSASSITQLVTSTNLSHYRTPVVSQTVTAGLGDFVWNDQNHNGIQDPGESGIAGVSVQLQTPTGTLTTRTNASGYYSFTNLLPGVPYTISFTAPSGYTFTLQNVGVPGTDSNPNPFTGIAAAVTLAPGEFNPTIDAGVWQPMTTLKLSKTADIGGKQNVTIGNLITYILVISNVGQTTAYNVVITDPLPIATSYVTPTGQPIGQPPGSLSNNTLRWALASLAPNQRVTLMFTVRLNAVNQQTRITNRAYASADGDPTPGVGQPKIVASDEAVVVAVPTAIVLLSFKAVWRDEIDDIGAGQSVRVSWQTGSEINTFGFALYRSADGTRSGAILVTPELISSKSINTSGSNYEFNDTTAQAGLTYTYWLQELETTRKVNEYGPVNTAGLEIHQLPIGRLFLPVVLGP